MKLLTAVLFLTCLALPNAALARGHGGGGHSSSGGHVRSYHGASTFRTSHCKSASCFRKHPDGKYVHPITPRKHHQ